MPLCEPLFSTVGEGDENVALVILISSEIGAVLDPLRAASRSTNKEFSKWMPN